MTYVMHLAGQGRGTGKDMLHHGYGGILLSELFRGSNLGSVMGGILEMDDFLQHVVIQTYIHPGAWKLGREADNIYPSPLHSVGIWLDEYYGEYLPEWF